MNIKSSFLRFKFWIKDLINGSPIGKPYKDIKYISEHTYNECQVLREKRLNNILSFAKKYSQFYKSINSDKLSDFPVMNKISYQENYNMIKIDEDKIPNQIGNVHIQKTSGSTGTPFAISQDTNKRRRRIAELKYFGKIVGFKTHDTLIHLRTWNNWQSKTPKQIKSENIYPFDISEMSNEKICKLCNLIKSVKAVCLRGYASSFNILANYVIENPQKFPQLKLCIAGSEALHDDVRAKVKRYLNCEIISQYANEECGILAQERVPSKDSDNVMYLNHASYIFEILKIDCDEPAEYDELGRIVVTDLHNYAFPIIRYDTGDVGKISPPNEYSNGYPVLSKLYGRRMDICYTTNNEPFHPMAIGRILKHFEKIIQWQFIQKGAKEYTLKVILSKESTINDINSAIEHLKDILGEDAELNIENVEAIPVLSSGKRKPVINEWKQ